MNETQARARHQQRVEELCAAVIRALSGEADLHFHGRRLYLARRRLPLFAPHLHPSLDNDDFSSFRGAADGLALRLALSDSTLHQSLCPSDPAERLIFDLLEQIRVESLAPPRMPGLVHNLRRRFDDWSLAFHHAGLTATARGVLIYTLAQVCRAHVVGGSVLEATEGVIEATRYAIAPVIGHDLAGMRRHRADQPRFASHALAIARTLGTMIRSLDDEAGIAGADGDDEVAAFSLVMEVDSALNEHFAVAVSGRSRVLEEADDGYRVFTKAYDVQSNAGDLVRGELLDEYRAQLDRRIEAQGVNLPRLARQLRALLAVPARDDWDSGQEEGWIDGRRLAQLVASPTERRLFRTERVEPAADCLVTFLIDCSGSMKEHAESIAMLVDVFCRALEQAGVASEILGFTTQAWNGGRARRDWIRAGRPRHPGRLNEVRHIVFKEAGTSWRRARRQTAALLKADLFREGIDGEAVDWACGRMRERTEERRLLLVVSDGSPMDSATNLVNDVHYLDHHLRDVVQRQEAGGIEIFGVGVGLDLSPYYTRSHVLDLVGSVGNRIFREIVEMIASRATR